MLFINWTCLREGKLVSGMPEPPQHPHCHFRAQPQHPQLFVRLQMHHPHLFSLPSGGGVQLSEFFFESLIDRPLNTHHRAKEIVASLTIWLWTNSLQSCHVHQATYPNCCISSYMISVLIRLIVISFF